MARPITVKMWALTTGVDLQWLETGEAPPLGDEADVRHQGLEPRTRWFAASGEPDAATPAPVFVLPTPTRHDPPLAAPDQDAA